MNLIRKTHYRIILSYILAVWLYGIIFAFMSGVFPATPVDFIKFIVMPFTVTIQLPILFMRGSGWLFVTVTGLLWTGISCLLRWVANNTGGDSLREAGEN